ncbi:hypothetical protein DPMN_030257 [Dreissena polymorpha]|uniref:Uncharacterized protein n=1 Tax=Dreissena polymorpha TaxID=45954 RepID=A0A9D4M2A0_DREPO|nr:hypothetical protein DPMN_030257 [Dreissena polymorpha]
MALTMTRSIINGQDQLQSIQKVRLHLTFACITKRLYHIAVTGFGLEGNFVYKISHVSLLGSFSHSKYLTTPSPVILSKTSFSMRMCLVESQSVAPRLVHRLSTCIQVSIANVSF